jgi:hypothetical protein
MVLTDQFAQGENRDVSGCRVALRRPSPVLSRTVCVSHGQPFAVILPPRKRASGGGARRAGCLSCGQRSRMVPRCSATSRVPSLRSAALPPLTSPALRVLLQGPMPAGILPSAKGPRNQCRATVSGRDASSARWSLILPRADCAAVDVASRDDAMLERSEMEAIPVTRSVPYDSLPEYLTPEEFWTYLPEPEHR